MIKRLLLSAAFLAAFSGSSLWAADWYMHPSGSDANAGTSTSVPVKSSTRTAALMAAGDTVYLAAGDYSQNFNLADFDKGTSWSSYSTIKCTTTYGAVIKVSDGCNLTGNNTWYMRIENVIFDTNNQKEIQGHQWKFIQCMFKGGASTGNSSNAAVGTNDFINSASYGLFEDCWFLGRSTGSGRYGLLLYNANRLVVRGGGGYMPDGWDDEGSTNPSANSVIYNTGYTSVQNFLVLDSTDTPDTYYGAYYRVNNSGQPQGGDFNEYLGNMAINNTGFGLYMDVNASFPISSMTWLNTMIVDSQGGGMSFGYGGVVNVTLDGYTILQASHVTPGTNVYGVQEGNAGTQIVRNGIVANWQDGDFVGTTPSYFDTYNNGSTTSGTGQQTYNPRANGLRYFTRIENGSNLKTAGLNGGQIGAEIVYRYGYSGTLYGETNYNVLTSTPLWPLANQTIIKEHLCAIYSHGLCAGSASITQYVNNYTTSPYNESGGEAVEPPAVPVTVTFGATVDTMTITAARFGSYGALGGVGGSTTTFYQECSMMALAGIGILRINMDWDSVENASGTFSYTNMDRFVATATGTAAGQCGMELLFDIPVGPTYTAARYVSTSTVNPYTGTVDAITHYPTSDMGLVWRWVTNVVTRYQPKYVKAGNEPDNPTFWHDGTGSGFLPNTTNYLMFASTVATAARAANPSVRILFGATAFPRGDTLQLLGGNPKGLYTNHHYVGDLFSKSLANGKRATDYIDIMDAHLSIDGEGGGVTVEQVISTYTAMMSAIGVSMPLWFTEFNKSLGSYTTSDVTAEEYQKANLLYRSYSIALSSGVERIFFQFFRPPLVTTGLYNDPAMVNFDFTPRNAYNAHQKFFQYLNGYRFAGTDNSGSRKGTIWRNGLSTRYVYGTDSGTGVIAFTPTPYRATRINPYGQASTINGPDTSNYIVDTEYFILDLTYHKQRLMNQRWRNSFSR